MNRKNVLAAVLFAVMGMVIISSSGCGGTQYGGRPSSIPRDVDSDDASMEQQQSSGSQNRSTGGAAPTGTGSPGTGTDTAGGTGTRR